MIDNEQDVKDLYKEDDKHIYGKFAKIFIVYALICFATSLFFNIGSQVADESIKTPATIGPITSDSNNTVYQVSVIATNVQMNSWTQITGQVLDSKQKYLFAFGKELWKESGRDSDGYWSESDVEYDMKVTLPDPGDYYFKFVAEQGKIGYKKARGQNLSPSARVEITKKQGSTIPHMWVGIFALIFAIICNEIKSQTIRNILSDDENEGSHET